MPFEAEITQIAALLRDSRPTTRINEDLTARLATLLSRVPVLRLARTLDWSIESYSSRRSPGEWLVFLEELSSGAHAWVWPAICSFDPSGFIREAAVQVLGRKPALEALPFLVLRTADWVSQVRICAERALEASCRGRSHAELLPALQVALELADRSSGPRTAGAHFVIELVGSADDAFLKDLMGARDVGTARWSLGLLAERNSGLLAEAVLAALDSDSATLRFEAAQSISKLPLASHANLCLRALSDPLGFVRRAALQAVSLRDIPDAILKELLIDSSRTLRETARREWRGRHHDNSAPAIYRGLLASARAAERALGLTGLAEVGGVDDAAEAVIRLDDASCRVRLAALRCLARLSPADAEEAALAALDDSARKVVALAAAIAARRPSPRVQLAAEKLIANNDPFRHRVGMRLLKVGPLERQVEVLTALLAEPLTQAEALSALDRCLSTGLVGGRALPGALARRLADAISRCQAPQDWDRQRLEERQRQRILFALRSA